MEDGRNQTPAEIAQVMAVIVENRSRAIKYELTSICIEYVPQYPFKSMAVSSSPVTFCICIMLKSLGRVRSRSVSVRLRMAYPTRELSVSGSSRSGA